MALRRCGLLLLVSAITGCVPQVSPDELPALRPVVTEAFAADVREQLDRLHAAVLDDPLSAKKAGRLGMAHLAYRLDEAAEVALRRAALLQPQVFEWKYHHAEALRRLGRFHEAITLLQEAVAREPAYVPARVRLGLLHMHLGDLEAAGSVLTSAVHDEPGNIEARLALARFYLRAEEPDNARAHLAFLEDEVGPSGSVYFLLADVFRRLGDREKAAEYLALSEKHRGTQLPIRDPLAGSIARLNLSELPLMREARRLNQMGQSEAAIEMLHRALARNPTNHRIHADLVGAYGALEQFEKADEHYRLALDAAPATAPLLRNLGRARFYANRLTDAREALNEALVLNPHDSSALAWLGIVRLQQKAIPQGIALLVEALEKNPRETMARHNLVTILRRQGRHEEAVNHMTE